MSRTATQPRGKTAANAKVEPMPASSTITIERSKLAGALKSAAAVCEGRNTIPILANVLLQAADGTLELVTTDLDCELRQRVPLATPGELATTVDAKRLAAIALATDEGAQITLALEDGRLTVTAGRSRFNLPIRPSNDFPTIARNEPAHSVEMPGKDLAAMLARVAPSVSTEATKYYMAGAFLNDEAGKLRLVSTDGHRLAAAIERGDREDARHWLGKLADELGSAAREEIELGRFSPQARA